MQEFVRQLSTHHDTSAMPADNLDRSARLALALLDISRQGNFAALATFDQVWLTDPRVGIIPSFGTGYLCAQHIPVATEADVTTFAGLIGELFVSVTRASTVFLTSGVRTMNSHPSA